MTKRTSGKSHPWFIRLRGSYLPVSWQGWLTYVPFLLFLVAVLQTAIRTQESFGGVLFMVFPQWVAAAVVMTWVAARKS